MPPGRFAAPAPSNASDFLASSAEPYRWRAPGEIDISRRESDRGARFTGSARDGGLSLRAEGAPYFLPAGTRLTLTSAAGEPIPDDWRGVVYFGPPIVRPTDPALADDPLVREAIRQELEAGEPGPRQAAAERLERAWQAPA